jgi:hypothetical protein
MKIANVSRFRIGRAEAVRVVEKVTPKFKALGVTSVAVGFCYAGENTGEVTVTLIYPDMATFAKATEALQDDTDYQESFSEVAPALIDRSIYLVRDFA